MTERTQIEVARRDGLEVHHRPGTLDLCIFDSIHRADEYRLRDTRFRLDDTIVDIGAHAGYFALDVLRRGAGHVHMYEISAENIELCRRNLAPYENRATNHHLAVWGETGRALSFGDYPGWDGSVNTGGLMPSSGDLSNQVNSLAFDDLVEQCTGGFKHRIRMVKMDAEGSEWPALLTSQTLEHIDELVGEYHEFGVGDAPRVPAALALPGFTHYTRHDLARCLRRAGFRVRLRGDRGRYGMFYADRKPWWKF